MVRSCLDSRRTDLLDAFMLRGNQLSVSSETFLDALEMACEEKDPVKAYFAWFGLHELDSYHYVTNFDIDRYHALVDKYGLIVDAQVEGVYNGRDRDGFPVRVGDEEIVIFKAPFSENAQNLETLSASWKIPEYGSKVTHHPLSDVSGNLIFEDEKAESDFESKFFEELVQAQKEKDARLKRIYDNDDVSPSTWMEVYEDYLATKDTKSAYFVWYHLSGHARGFSKEDYEKYQAINEKYGVDAYSNFDPGADRRFYAPEYGCDYSTTRVVFKGPYPEDSPDLKVLHWTSYGSAYDSYTPREEVLDVSDEPVWSSMLDEMAAERRVLESIVSRQEEKNARLAALAVLDKIEILDEDEERSGDDALSL